MGLPTPDSRSHVSLQHIYQEGAMKQLCDDLRQFAIEVRQVGFCLSGGVGERQCLDLSERMLASVKQAEARMADTKSTLLFRVGGADPRRC
jgi:hypothetical protein